MVKHFYQVWIKHLECSVLIMT